FLFVYGGFALATLACAFAPNFYVLVICRALAGFFGGVIGGLALTIASDLFSEYERGSAVSMIMMAFSVASVVGVPLSLYLADKFTWNAPFVLLAALSAVMWV
ncbi:MAG: MFS transporter, partial [Phototrophicales bacterium]